MAEFGLVVSSQLSYGNARHSQEKHGIAWSSNGRAMLCSVLCGLVR